jgi:hypothetical protein
MLPNRWQGNPYTTTQIPDCKDHKPMSNTHGAWTWDHIPEYTNRVWTEIRLLCARNLDQRDGYCGNDILSSPNINGKDGTRFRGLAILLYKYHENFREHLSIRSKGISSIIALRSCTLKYPWEDKIEVNSISSNQISRYSFTLLLGACKTIDIERAIERIFFTVFEKHVTSKWTTKLIKRILIEDTLDRFL